MAVCDDGPADGERRPGGDGPSRDRDPSGRARNARPRDRDPSGRARNARPRDGLGRPLARDASGTPPARDAPAPPPAEALAEAQGLLDAGRPFHAHEVLEAAWKAAPAAERDLWQGLAQLAVGLTHARRGNAAGAAALLRRGAARVSGYQAAARHGVDAAGTQAGPHGVDAAGLTAAAIALAARIESGGLAGVEPGELSLRLCRTDAD